MPRYSKEAQKLIKKRLEESKNCDHPKEMRKMLGGDEIYFAINCIFILTNF